MSWARKDERDANELRKRQTREAGTNALVLNLEFFNTIILQPCKTLK